MKNTHFNKIMISPTHEEKGFSLIEMTIVLLIIGVLVGGVLVGQNLLKSSAMKDLMVDMDYYSTATKTFQDKYNATPGDMLTASTTFGALDGTTGSTVPCYSTVPSGKLTCNGNGNGRLDITNEQVLFWNHLSNAGVIKGAFTTAAAFPLSSSNSPATRVDNTYLAVGYLDINPNSAVFFDGTYGNFFGIGTFFNDSSTRSVYNPSISPGQAQEVDNKMDDGKPGVGIIRSLVAGSTYTPSCATTAVASTAAYNVSNEGLLCSLLYITGF